jgi:hypothetical protein
MRLSTKCTVVAKIVIVDIQEKAKIFDVFGGALPIRL